MNKAESQRVADYLELSSYYPTPVLHNADLIVLNTCVVRQSAEDKVLGTLGYLKGLKDHNPDLSILVTGCFVDSRIEALRRQFPHVNLFFKPGEYRELLSWVQKRDVSISEAKILPKYNHLTPSVFVPIVQGCNKYCSYCVVPYRRGREKSRSVEEIVCEINEMIRFGVREVILLGQNVNSYGCDLSSHQDLCFLLTELNNIDRLARIRFLTSHPVDMSQKLIHTVAFLDKVCEHINLPIQSGDDDILEAMRRGYTAEQYRQLVGIVRSYIPNVALSTDVIVGFPGETDENFGRTLDLLEDIKFDTVHVAAYSPRYGTIASRKYEDDISPEVKKMRLKKIEELQAEIAGEINSRFQGKMVEILVQDKKRGKWYGRTRSDKLVFFEDAADRMGQLVQVRIDRTSPWALQGKLNKTGVDLKTCLKK